MIRLLKRSSSAEEGACRRRSIRWPRRLTGIPEVESPVTCLKTLVGSKLGESACVLLKLVFRGGARAAPAVTVDQVVTEDCAGVASLERETLSSVDGVAETVLGT